ncbi:uncharacterized protein LOC105434200 isoform X1 [Pogonomyrmex barbatus]|uniref:Uncharacterized protein LOC105434200 isoform X1 n=1 Tax=Pogonomyrmex barbatus TaxID=144034 RepID=A0A6I9WV41_9HYME|nr:uncharacterized protein LOC105434200 isoform X1 [Pogonomyrmex barbatus]
MGTKSVVFLLLIFIATNAWSHHHRHYHVHHSEHKRENSHMNAERKSDIENETTEPTVQPDLLKKNEEYSEALISKKLTRSDRRLEKMMEKAILKIITGDLGTSDMLLLKSLNYTPEEVLAIRERELDKQRDEELRKLEEKESKGKKFYNENLYRDKPKHWNYNSMEFVSSSSHNDPDVDDVRDEEKSQEEKSSYDKDFDFDAYNRQAVIDYENLASKLELQQSWSEPANFDYEDETRNSEAWNPSQNIRRSFDQAMQPHVIFKIPYDDSEFDSSSESDEELKFIDRDLVSSKGLKHHVPSSWKRTTARNVANSFHASSLSTSSPSSASSAATGHTPLPVVYQLNNFKSAKSDYPKNQPSFDSTTEFPEAVVTNTTATNTSITCRLDFNTSANNGTGNTTRKNEYEGLEWVGDDIYRVIPDSLDLDDDTDENETSESEKENPAGSETDMRRYQSDTPDLAKLFVASNVSGENVSQINLTAYQQLALAHRPRENVTSTFDSHGQKAIEDIKMRILALTGRFNLSTQTNQVQREKLTMFSPTCQMPRNTDAEAWMDPFLMNMHFQLNLTSSDFVVAARLRIYKLPQENITTSDFDEDEDDEKKIRISVYYYTKSLKKHRSKKRLMDSVVTPLTAEGTHLALNVKHGLRFWRLTPRNPHGNNHGLVIQIEDQDGRPLKPAQYIQQPSCGDHDMDEKAFQRTPALFVRACPCYLCIVNNKTETVVNCGTCDCSDSNIHSTKKYKDSV